MFRRQMFLMYTILFMIGMGLHVPSKKEISGSLHSNAYLKAHSGPDEKFIFRFLNEKLEEKEEEDNHEDQQDLFIIPAQFTDITFNYTSFIIQNPTNQTVGSFNNKSRLYILVRNLRI